LNAHELRKKGKGKKGKRKKKGKWIDQKQVKWSNVMSTHRGLGG